MKQTLGLDACKYAFTGAAPITVDVLEYFGALGIQINEVYGMSECTGAVLHSLTGFVCYRCGALGGSQRRTRRLIRSALADHVVDGLGPRVG